MCYPATAEVAQAFAQEVRARFPTEVQSVKVVRTERPGGWLPNTDVEVLVVAAGDPEELRPKVADLVSEYMWRDDVWVEVRIVEGSPADEPVKREGVVHA
jgi:hypothetical protein